MNWLYLYYSGENLKVIANGLGINSKALRRRLARLKLPTRPLNFNHKRVRVLWLKEFHVKGLRKLFERLEE